MSYILPTVDMSTFSIGQSGQIKLNDVRGKVAFDPTHASDPAHLRIFNESGSTLKITSDDGSIQDYIPAGAWPTYEVDQTISYITFTVVAIMQNPPIQLLLPIFYVPGEKVPDTPTLGNSPISGVAQTSSIQTLSNEGSAANLLVIDMGDVAFNQLVALFNDGHATWAVDQSGVKHQVIKISISGNALQLGQAGDISEVLGALTVDQVLTAVGNIIANGGMNISTIRDNSTGATQITLATAGITIANKATLSGSPAADAAGPINFTTGGGANNAITRGGLEVLAYNATNGDTEVKGTAAGGRVLLSTSDGFTLQVQAGAAGGVQINTANTHGFEWFNGGFIPEISVFTGAATGTYNHNFNGAGESLTPFDIIPMCSISGSQTMGFDTVNTTQCHITSGAGLSFKAFCL